MRRYQAYLFDLDGTLVDTAPDIMQALNRALDAFGYPLVDEALTRHWVGHGARTLIERAMIHHGKPHLDEARLSAMVTRFVDHYHAHIADQSTIYPGVIQALEVLLDPGGRKNPGTGVPGAGVMAAVVTNKAGRLVHALLGKIGLACYFDAVVCGDTLSNPKPAADPALHACELLEVSVTDTLFVGDSITDVQCARAAGCDVVVLRDGYNHGTPPEALGADRVIDSLMELV
ncbi:MAG: phosphoglycolate phosphatase [Gammaproteobacteria bacterium]|nr:phosphoglycolate phosphatase [Gammaproteobacteria bacterium]